VISLFRNPESEISDKGINFYIDSYLQYEVKFDNISSIWVITPFDVLFNPVIIYRIPIKRIKISIYQLFAKQVLIFVSGQFRPILITPKDAIGFVKLVKELIEKERYE
jgi:hypothetical protein